MAESADTLLQSSIKIRHGRKWKSRCCVLVKLSPVSDQVILKFYKSEKELQAGKELRRERIQVSAQNFCGIESCHRYSKNPFVLTVICTERIALLSYSCHADLLDWYHKIRNQLVSASEFKCRVAIPNRGKLPPGPAMIFIYDNHFAITSQTPSELYGGWSLVDVTRYGTIEDGFAFDVVSTKDGGTFVLLCGPDQAERLKTHMDAASNCVSNRWSHISDTVSIHEETLPNRRPFPQELQELLAINRGNGSIPSLPGSPKAAYSPDTYSSQVLEYYKQHASSSTDTDDDSVREKLLEDICINLSGGASSLNGNTNPSSPVRTQTNADGNVVDIIELYRTLTMSSQGGTVRSGRFSSPENSNGSEETTFTNAAACANYSRSPSKKTPIREQNYEIMASFDRFRNPMPVSQQRVQNAANNAAKKTGTVTSPGGKTRDVEYVNLPSPKKKSAIQVPRLNTAAVQNTVNNKVTNVNNESTCVDTSPVNNVDMKDAGTSEYIDHEPLENLGSSSNVTTRPPPLATAARSSSYRNLHHPQLDATRTGSNGSSEIKPLLPSTPTAKTFPPPFDNITRSDSAVRPKRKSRSKRNAPVPFDHGELIKPVGPIAMLSVETTTSGCSRSASESGDDVGQLGSRDLLDNCSEKSASLRSRSGSRSRSRSESCDNGYRREAIRPEDLPSPLPPDPLRTQLSGHLSDPSLLDSVDEDTYLDLNDSGHASPTDNMYDFPVDSRPASPTTDPSTPLSPFGRKMSLRRDSSKGSNFGTSSPTNPLASPTNYPQRRKRCNTEPTAEFVRTTSSGSSTWSRSRSNSRGKSLDEEGDGYLMMKPAYDEKLKRQAAKGIPQSPIHGGVGKMAHLRRSATVSGDVSTSMSPRSMHRSMTLRERTSTGSTPPIVRSGTLTYRRPSRRQSEGVINTRDLPRSVRTDRNRQHYDQLDPSMLKKLTHKLSKFASGQNGASPQTRHDSLPEITTQNNAAQFVIDPSNFGTLNNNIDEESASTHNQVRDAAQGGDELECLANGYSENTCSKRAHDCNANPNDNTE